MRVRRGRNLRQENGGNSGRPRLTVIIPVRNGSPYIDSAVRSALQGLGPNDRVLVSLNACVDNTRQLLAEVNDPRLRVIETPHPMSMSRHWDFVRQFVESEWIIYLGHDDGVLPYLTQLLTKLLLRHPSNDVFVFRRALYFWPGVEEIYGKTGWKCNGSFSAKRYFAPIRLWSVILGRGSYADLPNVYLSWALGLCSRGSMRAWVRPNQQGSFRRKSRKSAITGCQFRKNGTLVSEQQLLGPKYRCKTGLLPLSHPLQESSSERRSPNKTCRTSAPSRPNSVRSVYRSRVHRAGARGQFRPHSSSKATRSARCTHRTRRAQGSAETLREPHCKRGRFAHLEGFPRRSHRRFS